MRAQIIAGFAGALLATSASARDVNAGIADLCTTQVRVSPGVRYEDCVRENNLAAFTVVVMRERFPALSNKIDHCIEMYSDDSATNWQDVEKCIR